MPIPKHSEHVDNTQQMVVHAMLLPTGERGKVLYYGGYAGIGYGLYDVAEQSLQPFGAPAVPDGGPLTNSGEETSGADVNLFCSGHAMLADGRFLIAGGQKRATLDPEGGHPNQYWEMHRTFHGGGMDFGGINDAYVVHPSLEASALTKVRGMNLAPDGSPLSGGRWYPTLCTLADGRVLAVGGHPNQYEAYPPLNPAQDDWLAQRVIVRDAALDEHDLRAFKTDDDRNAARRMIRDEFRASLVNPSGFGGEGIEGISIRHANNTPEIYDPNLDTWQHLVSHADIFPSDGSGPHDDKLTSPFERWGDYDYHRTFLVPGLDRVFFASPVGGANRLYNPITGHYDAVEITPPETGRTWTDDAGVVRDVGHLAQNVSASFSAIMLPLLPAEGHVPRILLVGDEDPELIELDPGRSNYAWSKLSIRRNYAGPDRPDSFPTRRIYGNTVMLPTGDVLLVGGTASFGGDEAQQDAGLLYTEIYRPGIDWGAAEPVHDPRADRWSIGTDILKVRHYHGVALLLPDGTVWIGGSNADNAANGGVGEQAIEVFYPEYIEEDFNTQLPVEPHRSVRPRITRSPASASYGQRISFSYELRASSPIRRVALIRFGSCTHAFNSDQRYVALAPELISSSQVVVEIPTDRHLLPPGNYMLWIVDHEGRPCLVAPTIRICTQHVHFTADISNFSKPEAEARDNGGEAGPFRAVFDDALELHYEGFKAGEIGDVQFKVHIEAPPGLDGQSPAITVRRGELAPIYQDQLRKDDIAQRITYPLTIEFENRALFDSLAGSLSFRLTAHTGHYEAEILLQLTEAGNLRMRDGTPHWRSVDARVFNILAGKTRPWTGELAHPSPPDDDIPRECSAFLARLLEHFAEAGGDIDGHPFRQISTDTQHPFTRLSLADTAIDPDADADEEVKVFNYAVARVRLRAPIGVKVEDARVFFRLWLTAATDMAYTSTRTGNYPVFEAETGPVPAPAFTPEGELINIPFFADPRAAWEVQRDRANSIESVEGIGDEDAIVYVGCWLDINHGGTIDLRTLPGLPEGPQSPGEYPIRDLFRGEHYCMVVEIFDPNDPTSALPGSNPANSDNLAQRNIYFDQVDNPGDFGAHMAHAMFRMRATPDPAARELDLAGLLKRHRWNDKTYASDRRANLDELQLDWGNLPIGSLVTLSIAPVPVAALVDLLPSDGSTHGVAVYDDDSIRLTPHRSSMLYIPPHAGESINGLFSVMVPPGVKRGDVYWFRVKQVDGLSREVIGTFEFRIRVADREEIVPDLVSRIGVVQHRLGEPKLRDSWGPLLSRYLRGLQARAWAMGVDPTTIEPSPDGRTTKPGGVSIPSGQSSSVTGRVVELVYDKAGVARGLVFASKERGELMFYTSDKAVLSLASKTMGTKAAVSATPRPDDAKVLAKLDLL